MKKPMSTEEVYIAIEEDIICFVETYATREKEILKQINTELEILNLQIRNYLNGQEKLLREKEISEINREIAYL